MKILVVGKGGREHAFVTALHESPGEHELYSFPGSDAICEIAEKVETGDGLDDLIGFIQEREIDLCVAGEESYLVKERGLANACEEIGVPCWGPVREAAQLEASKEFAKEFMFKHRVPTGGYAAVETMEAAWEAIGGKYPTVLKFDGLAAGKGVAICEDKVSAEVFLDEVFEEKRFGEGKVLVEEYLSGPEVSIFCSVVDGAYQILTPARDYKRIGDNDEGPNTGGMGAVASRALVDPVLMEEIEDTIVKPTVDGLGKDGLKYRGFLYFGLMLTRGGPKMLEYNCRFGDPEAQAVMPLIRGDFATYVFEGASGRLRSDLISFDEGWSVCLILASAGYPLSARNGDVIRGLHEVAGARVYHAGTKRNELGEYETNGGRVLAVVHQGETRVEAVDKTYWEAGKVDFDGCQRRSDVGRLHFEL
ncbi:MAG: phosphoribosylamine--glycine ligase [Verrucomicrobiota bacterium]